METDQSITAFTGSNEIEEGEDTYYDWKSGETKTGWTPSEIVIYPWMKIKPIQKLHLNDYEGKKGIIKWIADELTKSEQRSPAALNGLIKRYTKIYSACVAIQKDFKILRQLGSFDYQFPFGKLKEHIHSICDDSLSKEDRAEVIADIMGDIISALDKYMYGIGIKEGIDYKTPIQLLEQRKDKVIEKITCALCGGKHLNDDKGMRQHEKTSKHQRAVEAQQKGTELKKFRTHDSIEPCELCNRMVKGGADKLTRHQASFKCRNRSAFSAGEFRKIMKPNVVMEEIINDIGEDGDSETYEIIENLYNEMEEEWREEPEDVVEEAPTQNIIIEPKPLTPPPPPPPPQQLVFINPPKSFEPIEDEDEYDESDGEECVSGDWLRDDNETIYDPKIYTVDSRVSPPLDQWIKDNADSIYKTPEFMTRKTEGEKHLEKRLADWDARVRREREIERLNNNITLSVC